MTSVAYLLMKEAERRRIRFMLSVGSLITHICVDFCIFDHLDLDICLFYVHICLFYEHICMHLL